MNNGRHTKKTAPRSSRRGVAAIAATVLLLTLVVGGTIAFLMDKTDPVQNIFEPTDVTCYVAESFDGTTKSNVRIQNTGTTPAYIRVAIVVNYLNADNHVCANHGEVTFTPNSPWAVGEDGYYYWPDPVNPAEYTGNLFDSLTLKEGEDGCRMQVEFVASAIQATDAAVSEWKGATA